MTTHLSKELLRINNDLSKEGVKLRIEQRGRKLNLRGPLPCRSAKGITKIQRLSLRLPFSAEGLKEAKGILQLILLQIEHNQFEWKHWSSKDNQKEQQHGRNDAHNAIKTFEEAFFSDPIRQRSPSGTRSTWRGAYSPYLRRLQKINKDLNKKLDIKLFNETINSYQENSRSRQQCAIALNAFAKHIGLSLPEDWKKKSGGYGLNKANFREIPSDNDIREYWSLIPNKKWRLAYGLMATYGLRNHEIFFCDLTCFKERNKHVLRILPNTKTGEHQVWPFHPEWVDFFELNSLKEGHGTLPNISTDLNKTSLQQIGRRVSEQFKRYKLPIKPYDLRHAWAIRTIHIGLPDSVSARMMGHSVNIHTKNYHHWITLRDQQKAVDDALSRNNNIH